MFNNYEKQTFSNITGSNYGSIHVVDCNFTKVEQSDLELYDSMIFESKWEYCNFSDALISKNKFGYSSFSQCNICDSKLIKNEFQDISFNTVRFSDSSICGSNFENCEFYRITFENVDFANCYFSNCSFHNVIVKNCNGLQNAYFKNIDFGANGILSDEKALAHLLVSN